MRNSYMMPGTAERGCGCVPETSYIKTEFVPAMAYVPWQYFQTVYETDKALEVGTIFPELDKPFLGGRGNCRK